MEPGPALESRPVVDGSSLPSATGFQSLSTTSSSTIQSEQRISCSPSCSYPAIDYFRRCALIFVALFLEYLSRGQMVVSQPTKLSFLASRKQQACFLIRD